MPKRITLNLTEQQHADLVRMAEQMGITLNALVCVCCWSWLREYDTQQQTSWKTQSAEALDSIRRARIALDAD